MKPLLPLTLATLLLCGCPDSKLPKVPPSVPEPKAAAGPIPGLSGIALSDSSGLQRVAI